MKHKGVVASGLVALCGLAVLTVLGAGPAAAMQEMTDQAAAQVIVNWPPGKLIPSSCGTVCCICLAGEPCDYAKASGTNTEKCDPKQSGTGCWVDQQYRVCATWYWFTDMNIYGVCITPSGNLQMYKQKMNDVGILASGHYINDPC